MVNMTITLEDLTFDSRFFHSARLQISQRSVAVQPALSLIVTLVSPQGLKELGLASNYGTAETVHLYLTLGALLRGGSPPLQLAGEAELLQAKQEQLGDAVARWELG